MNNGIIANFMDTITQTEEWNKLQCNPAISEAEERIMEVLRQLPDHEAAESALYMYVTICERAAILYGIHAADTIKRIAADPTSYLTSLMDQVE